MFPLNLLCEDDSTSGPCCAADTECLDSGEKGKYLLTIFVGVFLVVGWAIGTFDLGPPVIGLSFVVSAVLAGAAPISYGAFKALKNKRLNADVLVAIAILALVLHALTSLEWHTRWHHVLAAGEVVFIMLIGGILENYTVRKANSNVGSLLELTPEEARLQRADQEITVPLKQVRINDYVLVKPGERIPVDGIIIEGTALINQAPITGESEPVEKKVGDEVLTGSLNELGALVVKTQRVGSETTLAKIKKLVDESKNRTAPIQRITDRYASWAVPIMLLTAATVFVLTKDAERAVTVLIVACPCALILATPTAVVAAIGRAAKDGVLIKGGSYLEAAAKLDTVVFDKTGTLTKGSPAVDHVHQLDEHDEAAVVAIAAAAEKRSEHPLAQAIIAHAKYLKVNVPEPHEFEMKEGKGVVAESNGQKIVVGKPSFIREQEISLTSEMEKTLKDCESEGKTVLVVAHDNEPCAFVALADEVRDQAGAAIKALRQLGVANFVMLTGDNSEAATNVADALGIEEVTAGVHPEEKAAYVDALRESGQRVAMVGDGLNDAPAMARADVGVAMGLTGTDVTTGAASITLMTDDLTKVAFAIGISRKAVAIIKQSIFMAVTYNVVMVVLAVGERFGPVGGALAHQAASVAVIMNAMRLLRYRF